MQAITIKTSPQPLVVMPDQRIYQNLEVLAKRRVGALLLRN